MTPVPFTFAAYERSGFPAGVALNCYAEKNPTSQKGQLAIIARPGLEEFKDVGDGPIRAIFQKAGLFGGDTLILSAQTLYRMTSAGVVTALAGTVAGDDLVDIDAGQDADLNSVGKIATGDHLYQFTETTVSLDSTFNSGLGASSVCHHRGFWLASVPAGDQVFYQVPGDTSWDALSFMSAEFQYDPIVAIRSRGDQIALIGSTTMEPWALTGSDTVPFIAPYGGLLFDFGGLSRPSAVNVAGALIWVDNNCSVRLFEGGDARVISDNGLAEQIRGTPAAEIRASWFTKDQHTFYVLTLGSLATWAYDLSTGFWVKFSSLGYDYWRAHLLATVDGVTYAADAITSQVYRLDPDLRTDAGGVFTLLFRAFDAPNGPSTPVANIQLQCDVGDGPRSGQGSVPLIEMRFSDDNGKTFSQWRERPLPLTGEYTKSPRWNALGSFGYKGRIYEFQISDPVGRRFYDLQRNV